MTDSPSPSRLIRYRLIKIAAVAVGSDGEAMGTPLTDLSCAHHKQTKIGRYLYS